MPSGAYEGQSQTTPSTLTIPDADLNLGEVNESNIYQHDFHVTNTKDEPVTIAGFETTCDCLGITPKDRITLGAGDTKTFTIKLDLSRASRRGATPKWDGEPYQVRFGAICLKADGRRYTIEWRLNCTIVPLILVEPLAVHLGTQSNRQALIEHAAKIEAAKEIQWVEAEAPGSWTVEIIPIDVSSVPKTFQAVIRSRGKLAPRRVADVIKLHAVNGEDQRVGEKQVIILGQIVGDVVAVPAEIHHGRQPCGQSAQESIRIHSLTKRRFRVKTAISKNAELTVSRLAQDENGFVYSLSIQFAKLGSQEARSEFKIEEEDGVESVLVVPVRYHGVTVDSR
jgi:hypothetical protein